MDTMNDAILQQQFLQSMFGPGTPTGSSAYAAKLAEYAFAARTSYAYDPLFSNDEPPMVPAAPQVVPGGAAAIIVKIEQPDADHDGWAATHGGASLSSSARESGSSNTANSMSIDSDTDFLPMTTSTMMGFVTSAFSGAHQDGSDTTQPDDDASHTYNPLGSEDAAEEEAAEEARESGEVEMQVRGAAKEQAVEKNDATPQQRQSTRRSTRKVRRNIKYEEEHEHEHEHELMEDEQAMLMEDEEQEEDEELLYPGYGEEMEEEEEDGGGADYMYSHQQHQQHRQRGSMSSNSSVASSSYPYPSRQQLPDPSTSLSLVNIPCNNKKVLDESWPQELLDMPIPDLNRYIKSERLSPAQVKALKEARRRKKNRLYAQRSRTKKQTQGERLEMSEMTVKRLREEVRRLNAIVAKRERECVDLQKENATLRAQLRS